MTATAEARSNIALVKYWGKRDAALNLPATGSLSLTLDGLTTRTTVAWRTGGAAQDELILGGVAQQGEALARVSRFLDLVRARAEIAGAAHVESTNDFPTASGLASSASAFAALALAATHAAGLPLLAPGREGGARGISPDELSALARRGSGSAARSIFGGLVEMLRGAAPDGSDAHAVPLVGEDAWDLRLVVAVVGGGAAKPVSSRSGMEHTTATSPLYPAWVDLVASDLAAAKAAIAARDLAALGEVAEGNALAMHATAIAARPGVVYWRGTTVEALHAVRELRARGIGAWATIDAGPHVKALCAPADAATVAGALAAVPGVTRTITCAPGAGARLL